MGPYRRARDAPARERSSEGDGQGDSGGRARLETDRRPLRCLGSKRAQLEGVSADRKLDMRRRATDLRASEVDVGPPARRRYVHEAGLWRRDRSSHGDRSRRRNGRRWRSGTLLGAGDSVARRDSLPGVVRGWRRNRPWCVRRHRGGGVSARLEVLAAFCPECRRLPLAAAPSPSLRPPAVCVPPGASARRRSSSDARGVPAITVDDLERLPVCREARARRAGLRSPPRRCAARAHTSAGPARASGP